MASVGISSLLATAGCIDRVQDAAGMGPEYEQGDNDDNRMIPEMDSDWPDYDELERDDDFNDHFDACFVSEDETMFILMDADIEESVEDAEDRFDNAGAQFSNDEEFSLADEAMVGDDDEMASAGFRHSNAFGQVAVARISGVELQPDRSRAMTYAEIMFEHWESL